MAETLLGIETKLNSGRLNQMWLGSTLAETLLGIETGIGILGGIGSTGSTLAETLLGIETEPKGTRSGDYQVPLWLKPF